MHVSFFLNPVRVVEHSFVISDYHKNHLPRRISCQLIHLHFVLLCGLKVINEKIKQRRNDLRTGKCISRIITLNDKVIKSELPFFNQTCPL